MNEHRDHNASCFPPKILHNHCFQFLLSTCITVVLREIQDNNYAKCWGVNKVNYGLGENGEYRKLPLLSHRPIYIFVRGF